MKRLFAQLLDAMHLRDYHGTAQRGIFLDRMTAFARVFLLKVTVAVN